jgi:hypothetical protein
VSMNRKGMRRNWGSQRRETTWARTTETIAIAANTTALSYDLLASFKAAGGQQQGCTITRTHVNISVTNVINSGDTFSWGLLRGQNTDVGTPTPVGSPVPDLDPYEDWLMWSFETAASSESGAVTGAHFFPGGSNNARYDIRAQRRLANLQEAYIAVFKRQVVVAANLNLAVTTSVLLKLP